MMKFQHMKQNKIINIYMFLAYCHIRDNISTAFSVQQMELVQSPLISLG